MVISVTESVSTALALAPLIATKAAILALCATYVRAQLSVHRGFDLGLAAIVLSAGELLIVAAPEGVGASRWLGGAVAVLAVGAIAGAAWSWLIANRFAGRASASGSLFVAGLGAATMASGLVATFRGPGLRLLSSPPLSGPAAFTATTLPALGICLAGAVPILVWARSRAGLQAEMLDQDRTFAEELGCDMSLIAPATGFACGAAAAAAGMANALQTGSTPGVGMALFLQAAAAALLFDKAGIIGVVPGSLVIAILQVVILTLVSPIWADTCVFGIVLALLLIRGRDRSAEAVR